MTEGNAVPPSAAAVPVAGSTGDRRRFLAEHPDRFRRVVASNTGFDTGEEDLSQAWPHLAQWFQLTQRADLLDVGGIVETYSTPPLDPAVRAGYDAPLPDNAHLEGVRRFPLLIPISGGDENSPALRDAWEVLATLETPFLCAFSDGDHVTGGDHSALSGHIAGAQGQPHTTIAGARHFLQENKGPELAAVVDDFIRSTT